MDTPKYLLDQMFNGLVDELGKAGIECETATMVITGTDDSRIGIKDQEIVEFLRGNGAGFTLVTADLRLAKQCWDMNLKCVGVDQKKLAVSLIESIAHATQG